MRYFIVMSTTQISQIANDEKKGGPYTKQEQEQRRTKVYELHFEKGHSALKIAEMLDVNRNTINSDIKYWYAHMASQISGENVVGMLLKQIERLEIQRKRLLDEIEKQKDFPSKITLEKMVFEIDNKIAGFVSKMVAKDLRFDKHRITEEVSEEELSEIVRYSIFSGTRLYSESTSEETILQDTIRMKKCDIQYAKNVLNTMKKLGLEVCKNDRDMHQNYDLLKFASIRAYITKEELSSYFKKRQDKEAEEEKRIEEIEKKYAQKYGKDQSKWPKGVADMMNEEIFPDLSPESKYAL